MTTPDPLDNSFYFLSPEAVETWPDLPDELKRTLTAAMRPLAMSGTAENPFVYEHHDPDADPYRTLTIYWCRLRVRYRRVPHDPRYEIVSLEPHPYVPPGTLHP